MENLKIRTAKPMQDETKAKALNYYIMGLTAKDIETLTGINKRTLERYMMDEKWTAKRQAAKVAEKSAIIKAYEKDGKR